ncbi:MAG: hypothetical protein ACOX9B_11450 [Candidatus Xenobium sp.]|jgi:hypothetical protein|nr:hypothetical protein [Burkholderiales bacterium]
MEMHLIILALLFGGAGFSVWYSTQMKKANLCELERKLDLQRFELTGGLGKATAAGVWKGTRIWVEALPSGPSLPSAIHYRMEHRSNFTADIRPGPGLAEEVRNRASPATQEEKDTARPWRARLTEEEQAIIDQRRSAATEEAIPKERFRVSSPKADLVAQYLAEGKRSQDIAELFAEGMTLVSVGFTEVTLVKSPYGAVDMTPKVVESRLKTLRDLRVE